MFHVSIQQPGNPGKMLPLFQYSHRKQTQTLIFLALQPTICTTTFRIQLVLIILDQPGARAQNQLL